MKITKNEWNDAYEHMEAMILRYTMIGKTGKLALGAYLYPLRIRFWGGERTDTIHAEMMGIRPPTPLPRGMVGIKQPYENIRED